MINQPTREELNRLPKLYETEDVPTEDKMVHMRFRFATGASWYVVEYGEEDDVFFCYADLGDPLYAEWGYTSFEELRDFISPNGTEIVRDLDWVPKPFSQI